MKIAIPSSPYERILIVGGGFGGLKLARDLNKKGYQIVLIDKNNYHTFQPLLYQVATGQLEATSIATPFRTVFRKYDVIFRMAEVVKIIPEENKIETSLGLVSYDYLVIATGSRTNYFGLEDVKKYSVAMKSINEALNLRSMFLQNLEEAVNLEVGDAQESLLDLIVVGGGPTGIETAGALAELKSFVYPSDYKELDFHRMDIHLIEAAPRLLGAMAEKTSEKAKEYLEALGVHVHLNTSVSSYDGQYAYLNNGKKILSSSLIWTAGVEGNTIPGMPPNTITRGNRLKVNDYLQIEGYENIFAIGDIAAQITDKKTKPDPMVAPLAVQHAALLAKNFCKKAKQKPLMSFQYVDKGSMATIGKNKAVVNIKNMQFYGIFAWFIWVFVHIMALVDYRNKIIVFINYTWNYLNSDKSIRLILRTFQRIK